jgi:hypothetical protein
VRRLLLGIGVQSSPEECERYVDECNLENLKAGKLNNAPFDIAKMHKESFRVGTVDSWRNELSPWETALVERLAGLMMAELGFKPVKRRKVMSVLLDLWQTVKDVRRAAKWRLRSQAQRY